MLRSYTHSLPNPESSATPTLLATQKVDSFTKKLLIAFFSFSLMIFFLYILLSGAVDSNAASPLTNNYQVLMIADRDEFSYNKEKNRWESLLLKSRLTRLANGKYTLETEKAHTLNHELLRKNRGLELSELKFYSPDDMTPSITSKPKRLLAFDDRAGIIYEVSNWNTDKPSLIPRSIIVGGDGVSETSTFKNEWATVKEGKLIVGSWGKEFTTADGSQIISKPQMMYVKVLDQNLGIVEHRDWIPIYEKLRQALGIHFPGYLVHEAVEWSDIHKKWFFLPRRVSAEKYNDEKDLERGGNVLIIANEDFSSIKSLTIQQETVPTRGFSSLKFIPGTNDREIIALKTEENGDKQDSYVTIFDINGNVILPETHIGKEKFEGVEISYEM